MTAKLLFIAFAIVLGGGTALWLALQARAPVPPIGLDRSIAAASGELFRFNWQAWLPKWVST